MQQGFGILFALGGALAWGAILLDVGLAQINFWSLALIAGVVLIAGGYGVGWLIGFAAKKIRHG